MALLGPQAFSRSARLLLRTLGWKATGGPSGARAASDTGKESLPGPYPKTPEERAAAAKKYNMRLEDYEPYSDDGFGYGDYPKLPDKSQQEKSPYYEWDYMDVRRNYGEPMHWNFDMYLRTRVDTSPTIYSWHKMRRILYGVFATFFLLCAVGHMYPFYPPVAPKQYPFDYQNLGSDGKPTRVKHYEI